MRVLAMFSGLGLIVGGFLFLIFIAPGALWYRFFDGPTLITLTMCTFGGMCLSHGPRATLAAISRSFWNSHEMHGDQREEAISVLDSAGRFAWATVMITTTIHMIIILDNLNDPEAIAPSLIVALLPLLYGAVLAEFVIRPLKLSLTQQCAAQPNENRLVASSQHKTAEGALTLGVGILVVVFLVPLVFALSWATPRNDVDQGIRPNTIIKTGSDEFDIREKRTAETRLDVGNAFIDHMKQKR